MGLAAGTAFGLAPFPVVAQNDQPAPAEPKPEPPFSFESVVKIAEERAGGRAEAPPRMTLSAPLDGLNYDQYRAIRFRREKDPLLPSSPSFGLDLLPPGHVFTSPVQLALVRDGKVEEIPFSADLFAFDGKEPGPPPEGGPAMQFSGFRIRYPINRLDHMDEVAVFQGASYFRAIAEDTIYGLSARGLAYRTADPRGEEFPVFTRFWIEVPAAEAREIRVWGLLESTSMTGAYAFTIRPGRTTLMNVDCLIFPRRELAEIGIAPLTSMFYFGEASRPAQDDFREAVHDSEGLQMITGAGRRLWRPLVNPSALQVSFFSDTDPKGFGLTQRSHRFSDYEDGEARYDLRPSAWVEPLGAWGKGAVVLVEIPVESEFNDNIVAFWRPAGAIDKPARLNYRIHWCRTPPDRPPLAVVDRTRVGRSIHDANSLVFALDYRATDDQDLALMSAKPEVTAGAGEVHHVRTLRLPNGLTRVAFEFRPGDAEMAELQAALRAEDGTESEVWLFRWTPR